MKYRKIERITEMEQKIEERKDIDVKMTEWKKREKEKIIKKDKKTIRRRGVGGSDNNSWRKMTLEFIEEK